MMNNFLKTSRMNEYGNPRVFEMNAMKDILVSFSRWNVLEVFPPTLSSFPPFFLFFLFFLFYFSRFALFNILVMQNFHDNKMLFCPKAIRYLIFYIEA